MHVLEERVHARHAVPQKVVGKKVPVQLLGEVGVLEERLDLRAEENRLAHPRVVEGLDTERIPGSEKLLLHGVPDHEAEHAPQLGKEGVAVLLVPVDDHLGV